MRRIAGALVAIGLVSLLAPPLGAAPSARPYPGGYSLPGSQNAYDLLRSGFPSRAGGDFAVVFKAPQGMDDSVRAQSLALAASLATLPNVTGVRSFAGPFADHQISADGTIAYLVVNFTGRDSGLPVGEVDTVATRVAQLEGRGFQIGLAGSVIDHPGRESRSARQLRLRLTANGSQDLRTGFGPGMGGALRVVVGTQHNDTAAVLQRLKSALSGMAGISWVTAPELSPNGSTGLITVVPSTGPADSRTVTLIAKLRSTASPRSLGGPGAKAYVAGYFTG
jgi:MMPL family